jgi:hypothetical protein
MAQQGVRVSAAAAALSHHPAIFVHTYAHLYPAICVVSPTPWTSHVSRLEWVQRHGQPAEYRAGISRGRIVLRNFRRQPAALIRNSGGGDGT